MSSTQARKNELKRQRRIELKKLIYSHYGNRCSCCGVENEEFLQIDHKENDGRKHRNQFAGNALRFYRWIVVNGFPETLQLLCANCNVGRYKNKGICPHQVTV